MHNILNFFKARVKKIEEEIEDSIRGTPSYHLLKLQKIICLIYCNYLMIVKMNFCKEYLKLEAEYNKRNRLYCIYHFTNYKEAPF